MLDRKDRIFLGGTCAGTTWRDIMSPKLQVDYFNPVVEDWTEAARVNEDNEKKNKCTIHFYLVTSDLTGVLSIAEAVESSMIEGKHTILQVLPKGFNKHQLKSLKSVCNIVKEHGGVAYIDEDINRSVRILNDSFK